MGKTLGIVTTGNNLENHLERSAKESGLFDAVAIIGFNEQGDLPAGFSDYMLHLADAERSPQALDRLKAMNPSCRIVGYSGNEKLRIKYGQVAEAYEPIPAYNLLKTGWPQRAPTPSDWETGNHC